MDRQPSDRQRYVFSEKKKDPCKVYTVDLVYMTQLIWRLELGASVSDSNPAWVDMISPPNSHG